jgi:hypothetical protein
MARGRSATVSGLSLEREISPPQAAAAQ